MCATVWDRSESELRIKTYGMAVTSYSPVYHVHSKSLLILHIYKRVKTEGSGDSEKCIPTIRTTFSKCFG